MTVLRVSILSFFCSTKNFITKSRPKLKNIQSEKFLDPSISNYGAEIDRYIMSFGDGVRNDPIYQEMMTSHQDDHGQLVRSGEGARPDLRPDPLRALRHLKLMVVGMMEYVFYVNN